MVYESLILLLPNCRFMVQLHPLTHAQFVGKAHRSETKFEKGASDRNSRTGIPSRNRCAAESAQQREARLARRRVKDRAHRASPRSAAQRERVLDYRRGRLASQRLQTRERVVSSIWALRSKEDWPMRLRIGERPVSSKWALPWQQIRLTHETPDQKESHLEQMSIAQQMRLTHETPDQREARLEQMSIAQQMRLTHETPDQREACLKQLSIVQQMRLTDETLDRREARLGQVSLVKQRRLTHETPDQREARLQQMSLMQQRRLTHEIPVQREARLEQASFAQQIRLTHETPEETATRCEQNRESYRRRREQQSGRTKIVNFHTHLAALQVSQCVTCLEKFPGLNVNGERREFSKVIWFVWGGFLLNIMDACLCILSVI